ncbi:MAG: aminotransferase class V-fold PLP-dependent enzyme [Amylibacter sp.]
MTLDIDFVRAQFPAFSSPVLDGQAFFENAGGSYTCKQVIDRLTRYYVERKVQPYSAYEASRLAGEEMDEARVRLATIMGVGTDELSFGPSTTQNTYVLAHAFGDYLQAGDAIVVTNQDHEANSGPWRRLKDRGIEIREWHIDPDTGHLDPANLTALLDDKVKLVCFPHCSNVVGEINDVAAICKIAHAAGAVTCVDGVSYVPHGIPDVGALGPDIYLFSAYKTYGPHQGIMTIKRALGEKLPNQGHYFNADCLYKRFTPAGPDHAQIAASAGMADYIDALYAHHANGAADAKGRGAYVHDLMRAHETKLLQPLLDYLGDKNSVRLLGPRDAAKKAPTVAVGLQQKGSEAAEKLVKLGIMAGGGDFYGVRCLQAQGLDPDHGVLRVSFVHYTQKQEVDILISALDQVL